MSINQLKWEIIAWKRRNLSRTGEVEQRNVYGCRCDTDLGWPHASRLQNYHLFSYTNAGYDSARLDHRRAWIRHTKVQLSAVIYCLHWLGSSSLINELHPKRSQKCTAIEAEDHKMLIICWHVTHFWLTPVVRFMPKPIQMANRLRLAHFSFENHANSVVTQINKN